VAAARLPEISEGEQKLERGDFGSAFGLSRRSGQANTLESSAWRQGHEGSREPNAAASEIG
jgi:hypothetical protein